MADKQTSSNISVFSIGGSSMLAALTDVAYNIKFDTEDGGTIKQEGEVTQNGRRGGTITTTLLSTISDGLRVMALDASEFSLGVTSYLATLKSLRFGCQLKTEDLEGAAGAWQWNQYIGKKVITAQADLFLPATSGVALAVEAHNADRSATDLNFLLTLNGVDIELPMKAHQFDHKFTNSGAAMYTVQLSAKQSDTLATAFPASPVGTSTLLEKALNAPGTAVEGLLTSHATEGIAYAGNMVFSAFDFEVADGKMIKTNYTFLTQGAWAATAN